MEIKGNVIVHGNFIEHQEITVESGGVLNFGATDEEKQSSTEVAIKEAIEKLMEVTDKNGCNLFTDKGQWYAVYRVLSEIRNYPKNMREFCRLFENENYVVPCVYSSLADRQKELPKLACKVTLWQQYSIISDAYRKQCDVAGFLIESLGGL